jgi:hypothetical protein
MTDNDELQLLRNAAKTAKANAKQQQFRIRDLTAEHSRELDKKDAEINRLLLVISDLKRQQQNRDAIEEERVEVAVAYDLVHNASGSKGIPKYVGEMNRLTHQVYELANQNIQLKTQLAAERERADTLYTDKCILLQEQKCLIDRNDTLRAKVMELPLTPQPVDISETPAYDYFTPLDEDTVNDVFKTTFGTVRPAADAMLSTETFEEGFSFTLNL